jgi:hypothetical protein
MLAAIASSLVITATCIPTVSAWLVAACAESESYVKDQGGHNGYIGGTKKIGFVIGEI